jgi:hypothetical protein
MIVKVMKTSIIGFKIVWIIVNQKNKGGDKNQFGYIIIV